MSNNAALCPVICADADSRAWVDDLAAEIVGLAGRLSAAMCRWLLLIARLDAAEGCRRLGFHSTAYWLAYACGLSQRTATDHVRVAQALAAFPALAESMAAGRLSYSHVRAISRIATPGETRLVDDLIMVGEHGTVAHLEVIVRGLHTVDDINRREDGWVPENYVRHSWTDDSHWRLSSRLDPEDGALVESAIKAFAAAEEISQAQALVRIAELALTHLADTANTAETPGDRSELRGDDRAAVVINLDASRMNPAAADDCAEPTPTRPYARLANGPGLPDRVVKRLLCAGRIRTVIRDGTNVLDLGRTHRVVTKRLWRALLIRDHGHCAHPGCSNTRNLQAHHVIHWLDGGPTDLDNLVVLCQPHHLGHHEEEFTITANPAGGFSFSRPDGTQLPEHPDPAEHVRTDVWLETEYPDVTADAATPRWDGQHLNRDYAISVLDQRRSA